MTWVKLDDTMPDNPKVIGLSDSAFRTHIRALCYAGQHHTDGVIPEATVKLWRATKDASELVGARLWRTSGPCWIINDFLDYNPSRADIEARREKDAQRKADWRSRKESRRDTNVRHASVTDGTDDGVRVTRPDPTRPDPVLGFKTLESPSVFGESEGGHPALGGWEMTPDMAALLASLPAEMGTELMPSLAQAASRFGNAASVEALRRVRSAVDVGTPIANPGGFFWHHAEAAHVQLLGEVSQ